MVLVDSKRDMIQVIIPPHLILKFKDGRFQSNMLVDVVGGVIEIRQTQMIADNNKNKIVFTITDMSKFLVQCTFMGLTCYTVLRLLQELHEIWYKLDVMTIDEKFKAEFVFWNGDCAKLIGKSVVQMKRELIETNEDNPLESAYKLDAILKKELAIRPVFQPKYGRLSVIGFKDDEDSRKKIRDCFKPDEIIFMDFFVV
ncbi:unnamed protein product [Vicia faba]|uniref:Uncharacterized protein n=1 Tax=Vicia faba TaxID=3906 RepID=A0AAV1A4B7_VICFA|nr:unnamed protein product [Vicia faba]